MRSAENVALFSEEIVLRDPRGAEVARVRSEATPSPEVVDYKGQFFVRQPAGHYAPARNVLKVY